MEFGYVLHPVRRKHATTAIVGPRTRAERLLFYGPMVTTAALGPPAYQVAATLERYEFVREF